MIVRPILCRPFVGRRSELAYLRERRLEAGSSRGGVVLVAGDAGIGKSRLISEFCRSLTYSRWRIIRGSCREFGGRPYGAILDALSSVDTKAADGPPVESQRQYFDEIVERFAEVSSRKALVVVIEDLHWADAATLDLLAYLGTRVHAMRVFVLASFRSGDLHEEHPAATGIAHLERAAHAGRIDLAPLEGSELRTFIDEALSGFDIAAEQRRAIALAGEGNPFFTEELLKNAVQEAAEREPRVRVPQSVRSTLLERLRRLGDDDRRILTLAAVIGRTFTLDLLAAVARAQVETLLPALRRARDFQLIEELRPNVFRFRHGLMREAISADFLHGELRPLHQRIAITLENAPEGERSIESLAYHAWAAGDAERGVRYNELAGDAARRVHAHAEAVAFYRRALEAKSDAAARATVLEKIANLRLVMSMAEEGLATYAEAADSFATAEAFEREAVCRVRAAMTAYTIHLTDTSEPLEAMLSRLGETEHLARTRLHLGIAWIAVALRFPTRAKKHLAQVDERAVAAATDVRVRYHNVSACVAAALGDAEGLRREHAAWLDAARAHGAGAVAGAYYNGAKLFASFGLHEDARENIEHALRVAREVRSRHAEECAHATAALCCVLSGDLKGARTALESVPPSTDNRVNVTFATAAGASAGAYLGDESLIDRWFDGFEETIVRNPEIECGHGFAEVLVRRGREKDARALLHRVLPECELVRGEVLTLLAVAKYGASEDRLRARTYLARAAESCDSLERPALALFDAICHAGNGEREEAKRLARDAADGFRAVRTPLLEAEARELAGDVESAVRLYRRCGAAYHANRLEAGNGSPRTAPEPLPDENAAAMSVLSAREREIVELAVRGHSNLEIAGNLSISHKTVEKHLGSAFQKLGVASRRELRALR